MQLSLNTESDLMTGSRFMEFSSALTITAVLDSTYSKPSEPLTDPGFEFAVVDSTQLKKPKPG